MSCRCGRVLSRCAAVAVAVALSCQIAHASDAGTLNRLQNVSQSVISATVRIETESDRSSGVVISPDGVILTVAHGLSVRDRRVAVTMADSRKLHADVIDRRAEGDLAVLKLTGENHSLKYLPLSLATSVSASVLSCGWPARESGADGPVLRLGKLAARTDRYLRSSCALTAGDSGGPLVDTSGRLIGLHQKIGVERSSNLHLSIHQALALLADVREIRRVRRRPFPSMEAAVVPLPGQKTLQANRQITVRIFLPHRDKVAVHGMRLSETAIVTKLSELKSHTSVSIRPQAQEQETSATVVATDRDNDLALLNLAKPAPFPLSDLLHTAEESPVNDRPRCGAGAVVFTGERPDAALIARCTHAEPPLPPRMGLQLLEEGTGKLVVEDVSANSAASQAGLRSGDRLVSLQQQTATSLDEISRLLVPLQPGDQITFGIRRKGQQLSASGTLSHDVGELLNRAEFLDGRSGDLSIRRSGFANVIQHDASLAASDMGRPIFSSDGRLVGINIAKRARESVLALPIEVVERLISQSGQ